MSLAIIHSRANCGIAAPAVTIEVHISRGLPSLSIVGLPETAVKESKDRVRSALLNSNFEFPPRRITINLAPADLPKKDGGRFDLPIALGVLAASEQVPLQLLDDYEFIGELALTGQLRPVNATLPLAIAARDAKRNLILPMENADEAALVKDLNILPTDHILAVISHLQGITRIKKHKISTPPQKPRDSLDLCDVRGQYHAKRALEIAAAGGHALLMIGPPGTGKTMLASRLPSILPPMQDHEALATAAIHSISGKPFDPNRWLERPFRNPHHTASSIALVGGGNPPKPGEISLAHNGVLFLDELPEFSRRALEVLREPLEAGQVTIARANHQALFPCKFQLISAMNPCPCGHLGDNQGNCNCTPQQIHNYRAKISGPLLDRIDLHVTVPALPKTELLATETKAETSQQVRTRVNAARKLQQQRAQKPNTHLSNKEIEKHCQLDKHSQHLLAASMEQLKLSARAYHRILKVARTIADLDSSPNIQQQHLTEALSYRKTT